MKTIPASLLRLALIAVLAVAPAARAADSEGTTTSVKLSAPGKPATFTIDMPWADIHLVGGDGDTITVKSSLQRHNDNKPAPGELRRLDDEVSFELTEHDNVVTLRMVGANSWSGTDADFEISVPRAIALSLKTDAGGDLVVQGVEGDIEISTVNGEVRLDGLVGTAVINSMNGEVHATYAKAPQKPVSITSMNGEVELWVPADTKANVRLRSHNGSIMTDFGSDVLKTKTEGGSRPGHDSAQVQAAINEAAQAAAEGVREGMEVARQVALEVEEEVARSNPSADTAVPPHPPHPPRPPRPPMPPIAGGKLVSGTLNGGGVDIKISTMNGEITLRQAK